MLANQRTSYHAVNGAVHYDALSPAEVTKHFRGDVQYCPEDDVHFPTHTADQTLLRRRARRLACTLNTGDLAFFAAFICLNLSPPLSLL